MQEENTLNELHEKLIYVRNLILAMENLIKEGEVLQNQLRNTFQMQKIRPEPQKHRRAWILSTVGGFLLAAIAYILTVSGMIQMQNMWSYEVNVGAYILEVVIRGIIFSLISTGIVAGLVAIIVKIQKWSIRLQNKTAEKVNRQIVIQNEYIKQNNDKLKTEIQKVYNRKLWISRKYQQNVSTWFPKDYLDMPAVDYFINLVENHLVTTIQEAVEKYEQELYRREKLHNQQMMISQQEQLVKQQEYMVKQQMLGNILNTANLVTNIGTNMTVNRMANDVADINNTMRGR